MKIAHFFVFRAGDKKKVLLAYYVVKKGVRYGQQYSRAYG